MALCQCCRLTKKRFQPMAHIGALIATAYVAGLSLIAVVMLVRRTITDREVAGAAFPTMLGTLSELQSPK